MSKEILIEVEPVTVANVLFAFQWLLAYLAYMVIASKLLPSEVHHVKQQKGDKVKTYRLNGLNLFLLTSVVLVFMLKYTPFTLIPLITKFWSFLVAINVFSFIFSGFLYVRAKLYTFDDVEHVQAPFLPQFLADFWFGQQRNPEWLGLDLKMFFYNPSLIGLFVFVMAFVDYQVSLYSETSTQMKLNVVFWWVYLLMHYVREDFMLTTWDIIAENFGFMLVWGDCVYLPFLYSICGWYLVHTVSMPFSYTWSVVLVVLFLLSHYQFRVSNLQKHQFKSKTADASSWFYWWNCGEIITLNSKLLCSGFWKYGRHLNYTGEILVYLCISLTTCGCGSLVPYILPFSLLLVLMHRAHRDDQRCRQKYGKLWVDYCEIAKFRMIPYIY